MHCLEGAGDKQREWVLPLKRPKAGIDPGPRTFAKILPNPGGLQRLYVRSLPALGSLHDVELHGLAFLQTLETTRVDRRVVHEDILTVLARDEAEALRVIEPLHSTLFHFFRVSWY